MAATALSALPEPVRPNGSSLSGHRIAVREINRIEDLASLTEAWDHLLAGTQGACFFQTPEWLAIYWKHYGRDRELRVLEVVDAGETIGIVPLVVVPEATRIGRRRVLGYPLADWGSAYGLTSSFAGATPRAGWRTPRRRP
jgi:CelD/BcsL family acetyltransferase involved in cellulose biosynthesis